MAKKSEKLVALENELKELKKKREVWNDMRNKMLRTYFDMEGKYACDTIHDDMGDMHYRGYSYVYKTKEDKEKEEAEREAFYNSAEWDGYKLKDYKQYHSPYDEKIYELRNLICIEKNGYDLETKEKIQYKKRLEKELAELEERRQWILEYLANN